MSWNGNKAAVSLTFDDGLPCQVEYALPALATRGLRGTFFIIKNSEYGPFDRAAWLGAVNDGHEIGSHSVNHKRAAELQKNYYAAFYEASASKDFLEAELSTPVTSFCYPYTDAWEHMQTAAKALYAQARGGRVARADKFVVPGDNVNLYDVPSFHLGPKTIDDLPKWIDEALRRGAWFTLMIHGVGPDDTQWDNIHEDRFAEALDQIQATQHYGLGTLTFAEAAASYRGAK